MKKQDRLIDMIKYSSSRNKPKITICMPTHRKPPENRQDPILFKNLLQDARTELEKTYSPRDWKEACDKMLDIAGDNLFWNYTEDGLIVLACDKKIEIFSLNHPVEEVAIIADSFHMLPLLSIENLFNNYYLADLAKDRVTIYDAAINGVNKVKKDLDIKSFSEIYSDLDSDSNLNVGTYGGLSGMHHGHRAKPEEDKKDREKYFRYLDKKFSDLYHSSGMKFILAGTTENISEFKGVSQGKYILSGSIERPADSFNENDLRREVSKLLEPIRSQRSEEVRREIQSSETVRDKDKIKEYLEQGRIAKIYLAESVSGYVNTEFDGIVGDALLMGTDILVINEETMPNGMKIAAVMR